MDLILELGLKSIRDYKTVLPKDIFIQISLDKIKESLDMFDFNSDNLTDTEESKFLHINRILMLKFSVFIDSIKDGDELNIQGYRLEPMP